MNQQILFWLLSDKSNSESKLITVFVSYNITNSTATVQMKLLQLVTWGQLQMSRPQFLQIELHSTSHIDKIYDTNTYMQATDISLALFVGV